MMFALHRVGKQLTSVLRKGNRIRYSTNERWIDSGSKERKRSSSMTLASTSSLRRSSESTLFVCSLLCDRRLH